MSKKPPKTTRKRSDIQDAPSGTKQAAQKSTKSKPRTPRPKGWKGITLANKLLVIIGAIAAISGAVYAGTFVYQVWRQEQLAVESERGVIGVRINTDEVAERRIAFTFEVFNKGKRKLANLQYCILSKERRSPVHTLSDCVEGVTSQGPFAVLPNDTWQMKARVEDDRIPLVRAARLYMFVVGTVSYQEADGPKTIPFCGEYDEGFRRISDCMSVSEPSKGQEQPNQQPN